MTGGSPAARPVGSRSEDSRRAAARSVDSRRAAARPVDSRRAAARSEDSGRAGSGQVRIPRRVRRTLLIAHIAVSVAWLGISLCLLVLGVAARTATDPAAAAGGYRAMGAIAGTVLAPTSLLALLTGLALALGRPWGLTVHYWILVKLLLTLAAAAASIFALPALVAQAVHATAAGTGRVDGPTADNLIIAPAVAVATYSAIVAISVLKPWGRTGWARTRPRGETTTVHHAAGRARDAAGQESW